MYKFTIFSPNNPETIFKIIDAAASAGAGTIGKYSHCAFITQGKGTWIPVDGSKPLIGESGKFSSEEEVKVEMECPKDKMKQVAAAVREIHPYDKIAIDTVEIKRF